MGSTERRQNHRASLRREILDAASRLFVEEGFERATLRRIAAQIEYSPTTIYLYFKDKNELLSGRLRGNVLAVGRQARTPPEDVRHPSGQPA